MDPIEENNHRDRSLIHQVGALLRQSLQALAGLDDEDEGIIAKARRATPAQRQWQFFEAVVQASPVAIVMLDRDRRVAACNPAFKRVFGYLEAEVVGEDLDVLIATEATRPEARAHTLQAMETVLHAVSGRRKKDGTPVDVELFGVPVSAYGEPVGAVLLLDDITERKHREEWLRLANTALESAANAILICDLEGRITWVNPAFTRLTGYTAEEARGQNMRMLKSGKHDQAFYQKLWGTILSGQVWQGETINRRKDGSLYTEDQTIAPVRDERGEISHFISIKNDITARRRAEEELEKVRETTEAAASHSWVEMMQGGNTSGWVE